MEKIFFATDRDALEYAASNYNGMRVVESKEGVDIDDCDWDDSTNQIHSPMGETMAYEVVDEDGNTLAILAYWDSSEAFYSQTNVLIREVEDGVYAYNCEPINIADDIQEFRGILAENTGITEITRKDVDADEWQTLLAQLDLQDEKNVRRIYKVKDPAKQFMLFVDDRDIVSEKEIIGKQIREARESQGMSIRDLEKKCGLGRNHLSRIETGKYNYTIDTLMQVAEALGLKIEIENKYQPNNQPLHE